MRKERNVGTKLTTIAKNMVDHKNKQTLNKGSNYYTVDHKLKSTVQQANQINTGQWV